MQAIEDEEFDVVWEGLKVSCVFFGQFFCAFALGDLHELGLHLGEEIGTFPIEGRLLGEVIRQFEHGQRECFVC